MIRSLLHVGITVPDLEVGRAFYELFGLQAHASGNDLALRCKGRDQDQIRLMKGAKKKLSYTSFGTNEQGMQALLESLSRASVKVVAAPFDVPLAGIWFQDPHGDWLNVQVAEPAPVDAPLPSEINSHGRYRRVGRAADATTRFKKATPLRLGHLIKFSPDVNKSIAFYSDVLGMKLSDRARDVLGFLRGSGGGDHHIVAFAKSSHTGLHHVSFEVADLDEMMIGAQTLIRAGYKSGYGLGRHVGGSNCFYYIRDPWNSLAEYFWDIDVIPEDDSDWVPLDLTPEEIGAVWDTEVAPEEFVKNFEEPH